MMLVIPGLELKSGKSPLCIEGLTGTGSLYEHLAQMPDELCRLLRRENAKSIHVTDDDSFENETNDLNFETFKHLAHSVDIPVEIYANYKSIQDCRKTLENGAYRIIINDLTYLEPNDIKVLIKEFTPSRIAFMIDTGLKHVKINQTDEIEMNDYLELVLDLSGSRILLKPNNGDQSLSEYLEGFSHLGKENAFKKTIYGGINNVQQLWETATLSKFGVDSAVIFEALYENKFPCQQIWRLAEAELEH